MPVSTVRDVRDQLDGSGKVTHGWMGVVCDKDPAETRPQGGALVQAVIAGSPAAEAGLAPGDVVVRAAGQLVTTDADLVAAVRGLRPQDPLELQYLRGRQAPHRHRHPQGAATRSCPRRTATGDGLRLRPAG